MIVVYPGPHSQLVLNPSDTEEPIQIVYDKRKEKPTLF